MRAAAVVIACAAFAAEARHGVPLPPGANGFMRNPAFQRRLGGGARSRRLADTGAGWPTFAGNVKSTGESVFPGPGDTTGICRASFFKGVPSDVTFYSTGVSSVLAGDSNNGHFFGGTDNIFRIVSKRLETVNLWSCDFDTFRSGAAATPLGLVFDGSSWTVASVEYDRVAVPSGDGTVYAVNWQACASNKTLCTLSTFIVPVDNETTTASTAAAEAGNGADVDGGCLGCGGAGRLETCVEWTFRSPAGFPFLSPARHIKVALPASPEGLVLVSDTAPGLATSGTLYALHPNTGAIIWSHKANATDGTWQPLLGVAPAFDPAPNGAIFLAYGPGVVALNPATGAVVASWAGAGESIVASPMLLGDDEAGGTALFLHSALGAVWRIDIAGNVADGMTFRPSWKCDYTLASYYAGRNPCTLFTPEGTPVGSPEATSVADEQVEVRIPGSSGVSMTLRRGDVVMGGWPQVTSVAQRDALWAAVRAAYASAFPSDPMGSSLMAPTHPAYGHEATLVALMAAALPAEAQAQLHSGAAWAEHADPAVRAYVRLDGSGRPVTRRQTLRAEAGVAAAPTFDTTYPYSTPALVNGGGEVAVSQYIALGSGDQGFFVARTSSGRPTWAFANVSYAFGTIPFGRSRSSPAVDGDGNIYVAADVDWFNDDTLPTLFAFSPAASRTYSLEWAANLGQEAIEPVGAASPVIRSGILAEAEVYMAAFDGSIGLSEGRSCPTEDPVLECSGRGECDCVTGICACTGDVCLRGPGCTDTCNGNGRCGVREGNATCTCYCGWSGTYCDVQVRCNSANSDNTPFIKTAAGGAAVGIPIAMLAFAVVYFGTVWARGRAPGSSALPNSVRRAMGMKEYASVEFASPAEGGGYGSTGSTTFLESSH